MQVIMNRRRLLTGAAIIATAPAIVRAESLMKIWVPPQGIKVYDYQAYAVLYKYTDTGSMAFQKDMQRRYSLMMRELMDIITRPTIDQYNKFLTVQSNAEMAN